MGLLSLIVQIGVLNTYKLLAFSGFSWLVLLLLLGSSFSLLHTQCGRQQPNVILIFGAENTRKPKLLGSQSLRSLDLTLPHFLGSHFSLSRNSGINSSKSCLPSLDANRESFEYSGMLWF